MSKGKNGRKYGERGRSESAESKKIVWILFKLQWDTNESFQEWTSYYPFIFKNSLADVFFISHTNTPKTKMAKQSLVQGGQNTKV